KRSSSTCSRSLRTSSGRTPSPNGGDITKAHLMRCGDGEYKWPGGVQITLGEPVDLEAVLEAIRAAFDSKPEWTVKPLDRINGYELRHENTSGFFAEFFEGTNAFTVV